MRSPRSQGVGKQNTDVRERPVNAESCRLCHSSRQGKSGRVCGFVTDVGLHSLISQSGNFGQRALAARERGCGPAAQTTIWGMQAGHSR